MFQSWNILTGPAGKLSVDVIKSWAMDDMDIIRLAGGGAPCGGGKQPNLALT